MDFKNVNTYYHLRREGKENLYHARYEQEVEALAEELVRTPFQPDCIIGGKKVEARSRFEDRSPLDTSILVGRFPRGSAEDVNQAVRAAKTTYSTWSLTDQEERLPIFQRAAEIMLRDRYRLAAAITYDNGKDRHEAIAEVDEAIDFVRFYTEAVRENEGFATDGLRPYEDERPRSVLRPYGVWAVVCPFNFPLAISCGMLTGTIITGNTAVVKPASPAPWPVFLLNDIFEQAGLPPGVMNVVTGSGAEVGDMLVKHADVSGIVFTGSKDVGYQLIRESLARHPRPVIAEMGGKNAAIVTETADLERAVKGVVGSAFGFSGQKCSACSRVYVQEEMLETFQELLVHRAEGLVFGDPRLKETYTGPVIHSKAVQDYERYVALARKDGNVVLGGERLEVKGIADGHYVAPTIVTSLPESHFLVKNELFLPFLCVQSFQTVEEAVAKANDCDFGLTSGIYSRRKEELDYYFDHIEAGVAYANRARGATTGAMVGGQPFGGWKASGSTGKGTGTALYLTQFLRQQARTIVP